MDCRKKAKRCLTAIVCLALIIWSGLVYAQESGDGDTTAQAEDQVYAHVKSTSFSSGPFEVSVNVNTEICQEWPVQCSGTGHSAYKASSDNHNPVRIDIQVLSKTGAPVNNLKSASFSFSCPFLSTGGPSLKRLECSECFLSGGVGEKTLNNTGCLMFDFDALRSLPQGSSQLLSLSVGMGLPLSD